MQSLVMSAPGRSVAPFRIPKRIPPSSNVQQSPQQGDTKRRKLDAAGGFASSASTSQSNPTRPTPSATNLKAPLVPARKRPAPTDAASGEKASSSRPSVPIPRAIPVPGQATRPTASSLPRPAGPRLTATSSTAARTKVAVPVPQPSSKSSVPQPTRTSTVPRPPGLMKAVPAVRPAMSVPRKVPVAQRPVPKTALGGPMRPRPPLRAAVVPGAPVARRPFVPSASRPAPSTLAKGKATPKAKASAKEGGIPRAKAAAGRGLVPRPTLKAGVPQPSARPRAFIPGGLNMRMMGRPVRGRGMMPRRGGFMMGRRPPPMNYDPYGVEEPTEEDLDFIDDTPDDEEEWRRELRSITGYDPAEYAEKDLEEAVETDIYKQSREEMLSSMIAQKEDAEELRQIMAAADDDEEEEDDDDEEEDEEEEEDEDEEAEGSAAESTDNQKE